jgi:glycosyltransferase involved in cell wall biosynthesis
MRILHVIPTLSKGGAERICLDMVRALQHEQGTEVLLAVLRDINAYAREYPDVTPKHVKANVTPSISGGWKVDTAEWDELVSQYRPDVIHSHLFEAEMVVHFRPIAGVKYVTHCHDNMRQLKRLHWTESFDKVRLTHVYERHWLLKQYVKCNTQFIAISKHSQQYYQRELPVSLSGNIHLIPNAIDRKKFTSRSASPPEPNTAIRLVNIGSFVPNKNQRFLLKVVKELLGMGINIDLTFAGSGAMLKEVEGEAFNLGISDHVKFLGNVDSVEKLLWDSHLYVHSAHSEAFGLALLEAMASGLPVVSLDGKGNSDLIENGVNGYLVSEEDVRLFARRVLECFTPIEAWSAMSVQARSFSVKYDINVYLQKLLHLYSA